MSVEHQSTPAPSRRDIYWAVHSLTNALTYPAGPVARYLASLYPHAPAPDVDGDPRNPQWAAKEMQEVAHGKR